MIFILDYGDQDTLQAYFLHLTPTDVQRDNSFKLRYVQLCTMKLNIPNEQDVTLYVSCFFLSQHLYTGIGTRKVFTAFEKYEQYSTYCIPGTPDMVSAKSMEVLLTSLGEHLNNAILSGQPFQAMSAALELWFRHPVYLLTRLFQISVQIITLPSYMSTFLWIWIFFLTFPRVHPECVDSARDSRKFEMEYLDMESSQLNPDSPWTLMAKFKNCKKVVLLVLGWVEHLACYKKQENFAHACLNLKTVSRKTIDGLEVSQPLHLNNIWENQSAFVNRHKIPRQYQKETTLASSSSSSSSSSPMTEEMNWVYVLRTLEMVWASTWLIAVDWESSLTTSKKKSATFSYGQGYTERDHNARVTPLGSLFQMGGVDAHEDAPQEIQELDLYPVQWSRDLKFICKLMQWSHVKHAEEWHALFRKVSRIWFTRLTDTSGILQNKHIHSVSQWMLYTQQQVSPPLQMQKEGVQDIRLDTWLMDWIENRAEHGLTQSGIYLTAFMQNESGVLSSLLLDRALCNIYFTDYAYKMQHVYQRERMANFPFRITREGALHHQDLDPAAAPLVPSKEEEKETDAVTDALLLLRRKMKKRIQELNQHRQPFHVYRPVGSKLQLTPISTSLTSTLKQEYLPWTELATTPFIQYLRKQLYATMVIPTRKPYEEIWPLSYIRLYGDAGGAKTYHDVWLQVSQHQPADWGKRSVFESSLQFDPLPMEPELIQFLPQLFPSVAWHQVPPDQLLKRYIHMLFQSGWTTQLEHIYSISNSSRLSSTSTLEVYHTPWTFVPPKAHRDMVGKGLSSLVRIQLDFEFDSLASFFEYVTQDPLPKTRALEVEGEDSGASQEEDKEKEKEETEDQDDPQPDMMEDGEQEEERGSVGSKERGRPKKDPRKQGPKSGLRGFLPCKAPLSIPYTYQEEDVLNETYMNQIRGRIEEVARLSLKPASRTHASCLHVSLSSDQRGMVLTVPSTQQQWTLNAEQLAHIQDFLQVVLQPTTTHHRLFSSLAEMGLPRFTFHEVGARSLAMPSSKRTEKNESRNALRPLQEMIVMTYIIVYFYKAVDAPGAHTKASFFNAEKHHKPRLLVREDYQNIDARKEFRSFCTTFPWLTPQNMYLPELDKQLETPQGRALCNAWKAKLKTWNLEFYLMTGNVTAGEVARTHAKNGEGLTSSSSTSTFALTSPLIRSSSTSSTSSPPSRAPTPLTSPVAPVAPPKKPTPPVIPMELYDDVDEGEPDAKQTPEETKEVDAKAKLFYDYLREMQRPPGIPPQLTWHETTGISRQSVGMIFRSLMQWMNKTPDVRNKNWLGWQDSLLSGALDLMALPSRFGAMGRMVEYTCYGLSFTQLHVEVLYRTLLQFKWLVPIQQKEDCEDDHQVTLCKLGPQQFQLNPTLETLASDTPSYIRTSMAWHPDLPPLYLLELFSKLNTFELEYMDSSTIRWGAWNLEVELVREAQAQTSIQALEGHLKHWESLHRIDGTIAYWLEVYEHLIESMDHCLYHDTQDLEEEAEEQSRLTEQRLKCEGFADVSMGPEESVGSPTKKSKSPPLSIRQEGRDMAALLSKIPASRLVVWEINSLADPRCSQVSIIYQKCLLQLSLLITRCYRWFRFFQDPSGSLFCASMIRLPAVCFTEAMQIIRLLKTRVYEWKSQNPIWLEEHEPEPAGGVPGTAASTLALVKQWEADIVHAGPTHPEVRATEVGKAYISPDFTQTCFQALTTENVALCPLLVDHAPMGAIPHVEEILKLDVAWRQRVQQQLAPYWTDPHLKWEDLKILLLTLWQKCLVREEWVRLLVDSCHGALSRVYLCTLFQLVLDMTDKFGDWWPYRQEWAIQALWDHMQASFTRPYVQHEGASSARSSTLVWHASNMTQKDPLHHYNVFDATQSYAVILGGLLYQDSIVWKSLRRHGGQLQLLVDMRETILHSWMEVIRAHPIYFTLTVLVYLSPIFIFWKSRQEHIFTQISKLPRFGKIMKCDLLIVSAEVLEKNGKEKRSFFGSVRKFMHDLFEREPKTEKQEGDEHEEDEEADMYPDVEAPFSFFLPGKAKPHHQAATQKDELYEYWKWNHPRPSCAPGISLTPSTYPRWGLEQSSCMTSPFQFLAAEGKKGDFMRAGAPKASKKAGPIATKHKPHNDICQLKQNPSSFWEGTEWYRVILGPHVVELMACDSPVHTKAKDSKPLGTNKWGVHAVCRQSQISRLSRRHTLILCPPSIDPRSYEFNVFLRSRVVRCPWFSEAHSALGLCVPMRLAKWNSQTIPLDVTHEWSLPKNMNIGPLTLWPSGSKVKSFWFQYMCPPTKEMEAEKTTWVPKQKLDGWILRYFMSIENAREVLDTLFRYIYSFSECLDNLSGLDDQEWRFHLAWNRLWVEHPTWHPALLAIVHAQMVVLDADRFYQFVIQQKHVRDFSCPYGPEASAARVYTTFEKTLGQQKEGTQTRYGMYTQHLKWDQFHKLYTIWSNYAGHDLLLRPEYLASTSKKMKSTTKSAKGFKAPVKTKTPSSSSSSSPSSAPSVVPPTIPLLYQMTSIQNLTMVGYPMLDLRYLAVWLLRLWYTDALDVAVEQFMVAKEKQTGVVSGVMRKKHKKYKKTAPKGRKATSRAPSNRISDDEEVDEEDSPSDSSSEESASDSESPEVETKEVPVSSSSSWIEPSEHARDGFPLELKTASTPVESPSYSQMNVNMESMDGSSLALPLSQSTRPSTPSSIVSHSLKKRKVETDPIISKALTGKKSAISVPVFDWEPQDPRWEQMEKAYCLLLRFRQLSKPAMDATPLIPKGSSEEGEEDPMDMDTGLGEDVSTAIHQLHKHKDDLLKAYFMSQRLEKFKSWKVMARWQGMGTHFKETLLLDKPGLSYLFFKPSPLLLRLYEDYKLQQQRERVAPFIRTPFVQFDAHAEKCLYSHIQDTQTMYKKEITYVPFEISMKYIRRVPQFESSAVWVCSNNQEASTLWNLWAEQFRKYGVSVIMIRCREDHQVWVDHFHAQDQLEETTTPSQYVPLLNSDGPTGWRKVIKDVIWARRNKRQLNAHHTTLLNYKQMIIITDEMMGGVMREPELLHHCDQWYVVVPKTLKGPHAADLWNKYIQRHKVWFCQDTQVWQRQNRYLYLITLPALN